MTVIWLMILLLASAVSACDGPKEKPGKCIGRVFTAQACEPYEVFRSCYGDGDCPGTKKCCQTERCVTKCEEPAAPKPGECPHPSRVEAGSSSQCEEDTDCGEFNDEKCCYNAYGFTRCVKPREKLGKCIGRIFPALVCEPNEVVKSCGSDGDCPGTKKCCQTERCVTKCEEPAAPKPGECPHPSWVESGYSQCEEDTDCGEFNDEKCCYNAYGFTRCVKPREKPGKCIRRAFTKEACAPYEVVKSCDSDGDCPGTKKCCQTERCVTKCEEPAAPKPGECPHPSRVEAGSYSNCDVDTDCGEFDDRKCCENANGFKRCVKPRQFSREKPGNCIRRIFIALVCDPSEVVKSCDSDGDCPGTKKCCQTERCVTKCEEPAGPKPGECPHPSWVESGYSQCEEDTDCGEFNDEKCCENAYGLKRCVKPRGTCRV